jgi:hypothetical protein
MPSQNIGSDQYPPNDEIYGLKKAVQTAWNELAEQPIEEIVKRTMCITGETSNSLILSFLNEQYLINLETQTIETQDGEQFFNLFYIGIMLHYLTHAKDMPLAEKYLGFRELWGGQEYFYAFNNRVLVPLVDTFGKYPENFVQAAHNLGGEVIEKGEYGFRLPGLPRVPVYVLLWTGDEEVNPSANVLFDSTANQQMETEALVWISVATVRELKKMLK